MEKRKNKSKKGFTLIELLAVILILGVIALIAIPTVTSVIKESKKGAFNATVGNVVKAIELECQMEQMRGEELTTTYNFVNGKLDKNLGIKGQLPESGIITVDEACRTAVDVSDGTFIAKKTLDSAEIVINEKKKPKAYSVGDEVTLIDETTWVVVKDTTKSESEIKLVSTLNVHPNLTTETGTRMFLTSGYEILYDNSGNNSNVWENSTLKTYLDETVKSRLETSLNTTINNITIWGIEELTALGCKITGNETRGYDNVSCDDKKTWYSKVFDKDTHSWTKVPYAYASEVTWAFNKVYNKNTTVGAIVGSDMEYGVRPVITVSKEVIK